MSLDLERVTDDHGEPLGYRALTGLEHLAANHQVAFAKLADQFRFKDVAVALGGTSGSNAKALVEKCTSLGLARKEGNGYVKTIAPSAPSAGVECVE